MSQLIVVEPDAGIRATILGRIREAIRSSDAKAISACESPLDALASFVPGTVAGVLLGPGLSATSAEAIDRVRALFPLCPVGMILDAVTFDREGVTLSKREVRLFSATDLAPLSTFVVESGRHVSLLSSRKNQNIIGVAQLKGGVGVTTVTAALGACWASHGLSVALVDLDDVNPHLTSWSRAATGRRGAVTEHLELGQVPESRIPDLLAPVEGYQGKLSVVPQPVEYNRSFHFKANVLDNAPAANEYINSLLSALKGHVDVVLIDLSRSWGIATFGALPRCEKVIFVTDEDELSLKRSFDCLTRLKRESDDIEEFDFTRWTVLLNAYSGDVMPQEQVEEFIKEREILSVQTKIRYLPYSAEGRLWGAPGESFYECADEETARAIEALATEMIPFPAKSPSGAVRAAEEGPGLFAKLSGLFGRCTQNS